MRILFDYQAFGGTKFGGISRYFYYLMKYFKISNAVKIVFSLKFSNNYYLKDFEFSKHITFDKFSKDKNMNKVFSLLNRQHSIFKLRQGSFDIYHPTYYHKFVLKHIGNKPLVITVYDMISEIFIDKFSEVGGDMFDLKQGMISRADAIIAISEKTKEDIIKYFKVDESKINVVYLGSPEFDPKVVANVKIDLPAKFLLFVGNRDLYKNFVFFAENAAEVLKKYTDISIVCVGAGSFTDEELTMFEKLGISNRISHIKAVDDEVIYAVYQKALAFVFPSLYEGFGIPVLEAFTNNCPAILSNQGSLPEVGGDAAIYFDPKVGVDFQQKLEDFLNNPEKADELRKAGFERSKQFTWERSAAETIAVYQKVLGKGSK